MKGGKSNKANWSLKSKIELPFVFLACLFFFLAGLLGSSLLSQDVTAARPSARVVESVKDEYKWMPHGQAGDDSVTNIPFQVLSWMPRALYFPNFATPEQCKSIINMAKLNLRPSTLALRKGETVDNTQGIRTSSGVFISAAEDESGTLDLIEEKIAKVTMLPRIHGEAFNILRYKIGQKYNSHYDAFDPQEYGPQKSQRNGMNADGSYDYQKCIGLKVKPRQGDGLLFYSLLPNDINSRKLSGSQRGEMGGYKVD
ncbi:putative prolyl 4-hydroxylase 9 [Citrus sinensis]|uniref:Prolyl 4-hydroxylase 9 n=1 Tax=Citrus sinensis TaxID=2711 RepID=A0ACB8J3D3_CITSI|nr:putative prolyl 4-hydroxylase 9 [Citrus sinensis]